MAQGLYHGSIVGEGVAVGLLIGAAEKRGAEGLRGLHQAVGIAAHRFAALGEQVSHGFYDGDDGHDGAIQLGIMVAAADDLGRHEGAHAIVHGDEGLGGFD